MRITTLYLEDSPASISRMSAPVPDPQPAQPAAPPAAALAAAQEAATEAAWAAFERATFPDLNR